MLIKTFRFLLSVSLILIFSGTLVSAPAQSSGPRSQAPSRIIGAIDDSVRATIPRSTHPMAKPYFDIGSLSGDTALERMILVLAGSPEQEYEARTLLDSQQTKGSPDYHHWLTPEEFGLRFGPSQADIQQVSAWLRQHGFTIGKVAKSGRWIEFTGTSAQVEEAFQTQMHQYLIAGNLHLANAADISIPASLAPVVKGIASLHNFFKKPMISHFTAVRQQEGHLARVPNPDLTTSKGNHFLAPADFDTIYDLNSLLGTINGAGQTIAIVARSNISLNDVSTFRQVFSLAPNTTNVIVNGLDPGDVPGDDIEAILDTEWSGAVAPAATIDVVVSASTLSSDGVDLSAAFIVDNNLAPIMSVSFGQCEKLLGVQENAFYNSLWQQAAAQGISVFVAAGDNGAAGCDDPNPRTMAASGGLAVSGLASTPFNTAVGGTEFNETLFNNTAANFWNSTNGAGFESAKGYIPEMVWNESCNPMQVNTDCAGQNFFELFAGSGGVSTLYSKPSWQSTNITGMIPDNTRDLPDVSLTAAGHDGYIICFQEDPTVACQVNNGVLVQAAVVGGTSASSPSFAGIMALIDQKVGGRQGLANYVLYNLALTKGNFSNCNSNSRTNPAVGTSCIFNDITIGGNGVPSTFPGPTAFNANTGFDMASGLGSVDANNLATAWGNSTFQGSKTTLNITSPALTAGTLKMTHGQTVMATISVAPVTSGTPSGNVALVTNEPGPGSNGTVTVGAGALASGSFSGSFNDLPGGTYNLTAHYPGDGVFGSSDSATIPAIVAPENSSTSLKVTLFNVNTGVVALVPVAYGDPNNILVFDGTVGASSGNGFPSGNIVFKDGSTAIGTVPMNNVADAEAANCFTPITCLTIGTHNITATYPNGDNSFNSSGPSNTIAITIVKGNPRPIVTAPATVGAGVAFTITATIDTGLGTIPPTGTVQFVDNTTPTTNLGPPVTVSGGNASTQAMLTSVTNHNIIAQYSGDSTYNAAASFTGANVNVVAPFGFSSAVPSQTIAAGGTANFSVTLTAAGGFTGTVNFTCTGAPGGATCTVSPNPANVTPTTVSVPLTVTVSNTTNARLLPNQFRTMPFVFAGVLAVMLVGLRKKPKQRVLLVLGLLVIAGIVSCGGGGGGGTMQRPPTNATLTVTGTSGSNSSSITLNLTITH